MTAALPRLLTALLVAAPVCARAADPLTDGRRAYAKGDWARAEAKLRKAMRGPAGAEARVALAELLLLLDRATEAEALARELEALDDATLRARSGPLLARALVRRGAHDEAIDVLKRTTKADPEAHLARAVLGEVLDYVGRHRQARRVLEPMVAADDLSAFRSPEELVAVGRAARVLGRTRMAFQAFDEATVRDPTCVEAQLELGSTALDKGDTVHAEQGFRAALALQKTHPVALVGVAQVELEIGRTYAAAEEALDKALEVAPTLPVTHRLKAVIDLLAERPEASIARLDRVLESNPRDIETLALKAAAYDALGDRKGFEATWRAARKVRKRYAALFTLAARLAERSNRYHDSIRLARRALKVDPDHWQAHAILGVLLTRVDREGEGRRHLERYYERDDYDTRVTNLLNLYERWIDDYVWVDDPDVRLRVHKDEAEVARRVVLPFARDMLQRFDGRYRWKAPRPVTLELFHLPNLFALRSLGLPAVGSHGLCFGKLVTARSPSSNDFNWGMVVAHELAHVYALTMSKHRVPRWYTEGLSEYETNVLRPDWVREHGQALYHSLEAGRLPGVLDLTRAFTQAHDLAEVVVAYQLAALVMHHLVETAGYPAVVGSLERFAKGERLPQVLKRLTGVDAAAFDRRFADWLRARVAGYGKNWAVDTAAYRDGDALRKAVKARPDDPAAVAGLAAHLLLAGSIESALVQARKALALDGKSPLAHYVAAKAMTSMKRPDEARTHLEAVLAAGVDGYALRTALAAIEKDAGRPDRAREHLAAAETLDRERALPHYGLASLARDDAAAAYHWERAAMIDQNDPDPARWLSQHAVRRGDMPNALRWTEHLSFIAPYDATTHVLRANALWLAKRDEDALAVTDLALILEPEDPRALTAAAQSLLRLGRREEAATVADRAALKGAANAALKAVYEALEASP